MRRTLNLQPPVNPYIAGNPITGTEMFYGREDVFSFIQRNLIGLHGDTPVVLYGQRRTGKTSVLYQLHRHLDPTYRCVFMDLHGLNLDGMGNLMLGIANSISQGLQRDYQLTVTVPDRALFLADPKSTFEAIFLYDALSALGRDHLVLMLDELVRLDEEVRLGHIEREVFDFLRHLMQHHARLNFIFSLGSSLEEMEKEYAFVFNVALYHRISFLESAAAQDLILQPVKDHYRVAPEAVERILQVTSGHPYYTQLVCHCLFDLWLRSPKPVMSADDVDWICAHQANLRIIDQVTSRLRVPQEKVLINIDRVGNTSSASIPILIDENFRSGKIAKGDTVLMCALGAGISWGSALVRM